MIAGNLCRSNGFPLQICNIRTIQTDPPPSFSRLEILERGGSDRVGRLRTPKSAVSKAKTPRYPKMSDKMALLGGDSPPQAENFGVLGTPKMRFLNPLRSSIEEIIEGENVHLIHPPFFSARLGQKGGSILIVLMCILSKT